MRIIFTIGKENKQTKKYTHRFLFLIDKAKEKKITCVRRNENLFYDDDYKHTKKKKLKKNKKKIINNFRGIEWILHSSHLSAWLNRTM